MKSLDLHIVGRTQAEVTQRLTQQIARRDVPENVDPVRYHGGEIRPGFFELRQYQMVRLRHGGRARGKWIFYAELTPVSDGCRFRLSVDQTAGMVVGAMCGFAPGVILLFVLAVQAAKADQARRAQMLGAPMIVMAIIVFSLGFGVIALVRSTATKTLSAERDFLARWLGVAPTSCGF